VRLPTCFSQSYEWTGQDDSLSAIIDEDSGSQTSFAYDRDGHPTWITTPGAVSSSYEYDDFGLLTATTSSETGQGMFQVYNAGGQMVAQFDDYYTAPLQRITRDSVGRPTKVVYGEPVTCTSENNGALLGEKRFWYDVAPDGSKCPSCGYLAGRPARVEVDQECDSASAGGRMTLVSDYGYNSAGLMTDVVEHATGGLPAEFGSATSPLATIGRMDSSRASPSQMVTPSTIPTIRRVERRASAAATKA
jgi:YD repeat-containing protein